MPSFFKYLVGKTSFSPEHKALNIVLLLSTITALCYLPIVYVQNVQTSILLTTFLALIALSVLYYLSRFKRIFTPLILPFKACILLTITGFWFNTGGMSGTGVGLFPTAAIAFIVISPNSNHINVILTLSLFFVLLVISDVYLSHWVTPYDSPWSRYIDLSIGVLMSLCIISLTYGTLKAKFKTEQEKVHQKNKELEQANLLKSQFISNINHELRTPMNGIVGMLSLLEQTPTSTEQHEYIQAIQLSSERLLNTVSQILDFSNLSTNTYQPNLSLFTIQDLVEQVMIVSAHEAAQKGLYFLYDLEVELSEYEWEGDCNKIKRILSNLLDNAIKFTQQGEILIKIRQHAPEQLTFSISDTGIGIPADKINHLFDPFTQLDASNTRKFEGTGLGLTISKKFVDILGGNLDVQSKVGKGSIFSFTIPIKKIKRLVFPNKFTDLKGKHISLLTPHPPLAQILKVWLTIQGATVHWVKNIDTLSKQLQQQSIDLVLLDCKTPQLDAEQLSKSSSSIPHVLIQSVNKRISKEALKLYCSCLITPLRYDQFCTCIQKTLKTTPKIASTVTLPESTVQQLKILVVDDDKINRKLLEKMLQKLGYTIDTATNGAEALQKAETQHYQLILMDLQMPILDGFEASKQIIAKYTHNGHNPCPKIVAITANTLKSDQTKCFEIGMDHYLTKPITSNDLQKLLYKFKF